jgi:PAS domain S-box-containing protein
MPKNWHSSTALRDTAEQFHILVDSVEEYAIYMLDPNGNVITWNTGAENIKGYSAQEIVGKIFTAFYTADDVAAGKPQRNLREAARRGYIRDQGLRVRKDGSPSKRKLSSLPSATRRANFAAFPKSHATTPM